MVSRLGDAAGVPEAVLAVAARCSALKDNVLGTTHNVVSLVAWALGLLRQPSLRGAVAGKAARPLSCRPRAVHGRSSALFAGHCGMLVGNLLTGRSSSRTKSVCSALVQQDAVTFLVHAMRESATDPGTWRVARHRQRARVTPHPPAPTHQ